MKAKKIIVALLLIFASLISSVNHVIIYADDFDEIPEVAIASPVNP